MRLAILFSLSVTACVATGDIDTPSVTRHRDGGAVSGNLPPPEDDGGDEPAPPPPDEEDAAPVADSGGAPTPPSEDATSEEAPKPPEDSAPTGAYPSGPYAVASGSVYPNVSLNGYRSGAGAWSPISASEYYDPSGSRGIKALLVVISAAWCAPCQQEAKEMPGYKAKYAPQGVRFLEVVIENGSGGPATQATVDAWKKMAALESDVVADPAKSACPKGSIGLPFNALIDARTMKVIDTWSGAETDGSISAVDDFLSTH